MPFALGQDFRSYVSDRDVERCNKLLTYQSPDSRTYAISNMPDDLQWGPEGGGRDNKSRVIFTNGGPLHVLLLGEVSAFFRDNTWKNRVVIKVTPLSGVDGERLNSIMDNFSSSSNSEWCIADNVLPCADMCIVPTIDCNGDGLFLSAWLDAKKGVSPCRFS